MLFLRLEDAVSVALDLLQLYTDYTVDFYQGDLDYIRQEMEQKCYIAGPKNADKDLNDLTFEICPESIAAAITNNRLREWCIDMRVNIWLAVLRMNLNFGEEAEHNAEEAEESGTA